MLAAVLGNHPDELRADFQRFYGLNLDGMGCEYTVAHAAALASNLPPESATVRAMVPEAAWDAHTYLLSAIEYDLRVLVWQNSRDGQHNRNRPKRPQTPADVERIRKKTVETDFAAIAEALGLGRREVGDG